MASRCAARWRCRTMHWVGPGRRGHSAPAPLNTSGPSCWSPSPRTTLLGTSARRRATTRCHRCWPSGWARRGAAVWRAARAVSVQGVQGPQIRGDAGAGGARGHRGGRHSQHRLRPACDLSSRRGPPGADPVCVRRGFAQGCADRAVRAERLEQGAKMMMRTTHVLRTLMLGAVVFGGCRGRRGDDDGDDEVSRKATPMAPVAPGPP